MSGVADGRGHGPKLLMSTRHSHTGLPTIFSLFLFPHTDTCMIRMMDYGGYEYVSMLKLINVDTDNLSLSVHGEVDHSPFLQQ